MIEQLQDKRRVFLDSQTIIYFVEGDGKYCSITRPLFEMIEQGRLDGFSSYLTLLEVLVRPLREGRSDLVQQYCEALLSSKNFAIFPLDRGIAEKGAAIRAHYRFRTPDAVQLATAVEHKADVFVTNDDRLRRFEEMEVLILGDLLPKDDPETCGTS